MTLAFAPPDDDKSSLEEGRLFTPRFDAAGLLTAVVTDADQGTVLMVAHMNAEALALTIESGVAHFWSRSRNQLWRKGDTSGSVLHIAEIRTDCDQDALWLKVRVAGDGTSCHTGRTSCFYRRVELEQGQAVLRMSESASRPK